VRPLTVITGILFGSCLAIAISLTAVLFVFLGLGDDYPRVQHEFQPLLRSALVFFGMTVISGASFYSLLIEHPARSWLIVLMLTGLAATVWYYLP
jgi:hypothetical protein